MAAGAEVPLTTTEPGFGASHDTTSRSRTGRWTGFKGAGSGGKGRLVRSEEVVAWPDGPVQRDSTGSAGDSNRPGDPVKVASIGRERAFESIALGSAESDLPIQIHRAAG